MSFGHSGCGGASVREIEAQTRLDFMAELPSAEQERIEAEKAGVW